MELTEKSERKGRAIASDQNGLLVKRAGRAEQGLLTVLIAPDVFE